MNDKTTTIDLAEMRRQLMAINEHVGDVFLIGCAWNGKVMRVTVGKVPGIRRPWVMIMDEESDYAKNTDELIVEFAAGARRWFGEGKPDDGS